MTTAELMQAMADAGAPLEAIIIAVRAIDERDAELRAKEAAVQARRAADAERKRAERAELKASTDNPRTKRGQSAPPLNDIYSKPPEPIEANASIPPFDENLVEAWNAGPAANGARKAVRLDASRKTLLKARLRENTEAEIIGAIRNLGASKFHCGENDRNWRASLGWFLKAENFLKALEMAPAPSKAANDPRFATEEGRKAYLAELEAKPKPWMQPDRLKADMPPGKPVTFASLTAGQRQ